MSEAMTIIYVKYPGIQIPGPIGGIGRVKGMAVGL
jgi:hypothetical protein